MLTQLTISNFAIIDELEINFKEGLSVLTGETGGGKSVIINALDFLLGARANTDLLKTGTQKAQVEGCFVLPKKLNPYLEKNGFETDEDTITISRELTKDGSKARINGSLANVSHLLFIREHLLDIHQQSEHIELLKPEKQLEILDGSGSAEHKKIIDEYKKTFFEYQALKNKLNNYLQNKEKIEKEIDYLKFQINEIRSATIKDINEEEELNSKREILLNKKELLDNANLIAELINGNDVGAYHGTPLQAMLSEIKKLIRNSSNHDESFEPYSNIIENITDEIKDLSSFVNNYRENINQDDKALIEIEERLDLFHNLKRKYGKSLFDIMKYCEKIEFELNAVETIHELSLLENTFKTKEKEINDLAKKLTKSREKTTRDFVDKVNEELQTLGFNDVGAYHGMPLLVVEFIDCDLSINGKEQIQFLFSANPDEPPKPLLKIISGGELSRVMLAIKSIACKGVLQHAPTMVFDEIDMGVSGEIASSVAKKLYKISRQNQLICITHQPIIASMADSHFVIEKNLDRDRVNRVSIKEISKDEKADALATLLTPEKKQSEGITEDARTFAKSLIENAKRIKEKELIKVV